MSEVKSDIKGFRFVGKGKYEPIDPNDAMLIEMAQGAKVNGMTLPSGCKIPDGGNWEFSKGYLLDCTGDQRSTMSTDNYFTVPTVEDDFYPDDELPKPCGAKLTPAETDAVFNAEHPDIRMSFDPAIHAQQWNAEAYANRLAPIDGMYSTFIYREAKSTTDLVQSEARRRQFIENWWLSRQRAKSAEVTFLTKIYGVILGVAVIAMIIAFGWFYGKGIPH